MFEAATYAARRRGLAEQVGNGVILLMGHDEAAMNFAANVYPFRQDSTFLYYTGLDEPDLAVWLDVDAGTEALYGPEADPDAVVWTGPRPSLRDHADRAGIAEVGRWAELESAARKARRAGRAIRYVPAYRAQTQLKLAAVLDVPVKQVASGACGELIRAVVAQRSIKSAEEVRRIEHAIDITAQMQVAAMLQVWPGCVERQIVGCVEDIARVAGGRCSFPTIFSVRGEILHNPYYDNVLQAGQIAVHDCGAEEPGHYAGDITRTIPIGGRFDSRQREVYRLVLETQERAIEAVRPGVEFRAIHRQACINLAEGLKGLGLMKGDAEDAVTAGAHALFFPCGLGHMMGLDVHDMEGLGEDYVGYTETIRRSDQFGLRSLRLARALEPGFVVTVEPGVYFIGELIDRWRAERRHTAFIDYERVEAYRGFGGVRVEDDVLVTETGCRVLGPPIPKAIDEVEALTSA